MSINFLFPPCTQRRGDIGKEPRSRKEGTSLSLKSSQMPQVPSKARTSVAPTNYPSYWLLQQLPGATRGRGHPSSQSGCWLCLSPLLPPYGAHFAVHHPPLPQFRTLMDFSMYELQPSDQREVPPPPRPRPRQRPYRDQNPVRARCTRSTW